MDIDRNIPIIGKKEDEQLPPGQVNMGPMDQLKPEDFIDKAIKRATDSDDEMVPMALQWESMDVSETKTMWRPVLSIPGLAKYELPYRDRQEFYEGERQMYVMEFANACCNYIFGYDMFDTKRKGYALHFKPNKDFAGLPTIPMPRATQERIKADEEEKRKNAKIPEGLFPLHVLDTERRLQNVLIVSEASGFGEWMNNVPKELVVTNYDATGKVVTVRKYRQIMK